MQSNTRLGWLLPTFVIAVTIAVYANTLTFDFVFDDHALAGFGRVNSWARIPGFFFEHVWRWNSPEAAGAYYRPVFMIWTLLNFKLFGLVPLGWHVTTVLLHTIATLLVYCVSLRLSHDRWLAACASLLFGLHATHLESVAWISGATDPLAAVFLLGSFLLYILPCPRRIASVILYAIALLSKEAAIVLPALLFSYEMLLHTGRHATRARLSQALHAAIPYLAVTLGYLGLRILALHTLSPAVNPVSRVDMILTWPTMVLFYLVHLVWPAGLSIFYSLNLVSGFNVPLLVLPCAALTFVFAALYWWWRKSPIVAFCGIWMFVALIPVLNIRVFLANDFLHDRYLYISSIGFCLLAAVGIFSIRAPAIRWVLSVVAASALAVATLQQSECWQNDSELFERAVSIAPDSALANANQGTAVLLSGRPADAIPYFDRAIELQPDQFEASYLLARCYYELGQYPQAETEFERATVLRPTDPKPYLYYGLSQGKQDRLDLAERAIRHAIQLKGPADVQDYHFSLGSILEQKGDVSGALTEYEAEVRENPEPSKALDAIATLRANHLNKGALPR